MITLTMGTLTVGTLTMGTLTVGTLTVVLSQLMMLFFSEERGS